MPVEPLLAPLVGTWHGAGNGEFPGMDPFPYEEEVQFQDVGTRDVAYAQRAWDPASGATLHSEAGILRCSPEGVLAMTVAQPRTAEVSEGTIQGGEIELHSTSIARAANGAPLAGTHRHYRVIGDELSYTFEMATLSVGEVTQHLSGTLARVTRP